MAEVTFLNWLLLGLTFIVTIPGSALLWRVFDATDAVSGPVQRQAQYESCAFVFFAVVCALALYNIKNGNGYAAVRNLAVALVLYITVLSNYLNFNVLNNLRIVDQSNDAVYILNGQVLEHGNRQKYLAGLILGWFGLFFGLLSTTVTCLCNCKAGGLVKFFWIFALILLITGNVVAWTSESASTYNTQSGTDLEIELWLFQVTTVVMVQWFVLTLGIFTNQSDLLSAAAFIFGVTSIWIPIYYFAIQHTSPDRSNYIWAGLILDWAAAIAMGIAALLAVCFLLLFSLSFTFLDVLQRDVVMCHIIAS